MVSVAFISLLITTQFAQRRKYLTTGVKNIFESSWSGELQEFKIILRTFWWFSATQAAQILSDDFFRFSRLSHFLPSYSAQLKFRSEDILFYSFPQLSHFLPQSTDQLKSDNLFFVFLRHSSVIFLPPSPTHLICESNLNFTFSAQNFFDFF